MISFIFHFSRKRKFSLAGHFPRWLKLSHSWKCVALFKFGCLGEFLITWVGMPDAPISTIYPRFLYQKLVTLDNNFAVQTASEKIKNGVFTQYNDQ